MSGVYNYGEHKHHSSKQEEPKDNFVAVQREQFSRAYDLANKSLNEEREMTMWALITTWVFILIICIFLVVFIYYYIKNTNAMINILAQSGNRQN